MFCKRDPVLQIEVSNNQLNWMYKSIYYIHEPQLVHSIYLNKITEIN